MANCLPSLGFGLACWVGLFAAASDAKAQHGIIRGVVVDSAGGPLSEATVGITALRQGYRTEANGRFTFDDLPLGELEVSVRHIGYAPRKLTVSVTATSGDSLNVVLTAQPAILEAMSVSASEKRHRQGIEDFYWRATRGVGTFFTRDQILSRQPQVTSDMLRAIPGAPLARGSNGSQGIRFLAGANPRNACAPALWLDGQRVLGMEIDELTVHDLAGIELYQGTSITPTQFSARASCGTIVIWSRSPTPLGNREPNAASA